MVHARDVKRIRGSSVKRRILLATSTSVVMMGAGITSAHATQTYGLGLSIKSARPAGTRLYASPDAGCVTLRIRGDRAVLKIRTWGFAPMSTFRIRHESGEKWTGGKIGTDLYRVVTVTANGLTDTTENGPAGYSKVARSTWRGGCPLHWNSRLMGHS